MSALHTSVDVVLLSTQAALVHFHAVSVLADFPDTPRSTTWKDHLTPLAFTPFSNRSASIGETAEDQMEWRLFPSKVSRHWPGMPPVLTRSRPTTYTPPFWSLVQRQSRPRTWRDKNILNWWQTLSLFQWLLKHQGSSVQPDAPF